ncbi:hypothetical protein BGZ83_010391 [Gryganskiella cystojenkinii]|nr:hypothetical protein BGZ83_010391 [Gryganskiella cystojenkinii]
MEHEVKQQAKKAIDTLYGWLFQGPSYDPFPTTGSACVKNYDPSTGGSASGEGHSAHGNGGGAGFLGNYADKLQDKVAGVVSTASSAAANAASNFASGISGGHGAGHHHQNGHNANNHHHSQASIGGNSPSSIRNIGAGTGAGAGGSGHSFFSTLQSYLNPEFWQNLSPATVIDRLIEELHARFGWNHWAETLGVDPKWLLLLLLLPLFLILLTTCLSLGGQPSSVGGRSHPHAGRGAGSSSRHDDGDKDGHGSSSSSSSSSFSKQGGGSSSNAGSSSSSNVGKGGKNRQGKKGGGAQDNAGSAGQNGSDAGQKHQLRNSDSVSASETHPAQALGDDSAHSTSHHGSSVHDIVGQSDAQQEQSEIGLDNRDEYVNDDHENNAASDAILDRPASPGWRPMKDLHETNTDFVETHQHHFAPGTQKQGHASGAAGGAAGHGSDSLDADSSKTQMRTRTPKAYSFKEADRHRHQPHNATHVFGQTIGDKGSSSSSGQQHGGLASKLMSFAETPVWKNLDGISGGVLGSALATVAMLTNTAEAASTTLKDKIPQSWTELTEDLRGSFDEALNEGIEGSGIDQDMNWGFSSNTKRPKTTLGQAPAASASSSSSSSSSKSASNSGIATASAATKSTTNASAPAKEHSMAANPPRLRQRSVGHGQPGLASTIATAAATAAASTSTAGSSGKIPTKAAQNRSRHSVEDISVQRGPLPKTAHKDSKGVSGADSASDSNASTPTLASTQQFKFGSADLSKGYGHGLGVGLGHGHDDGKKADAGEKAESTDPTKIDWGLAAPSDQDGEKAKAESMDSPSHTDLSRLQWGSNNSNKGSSSSHASSAWAQKAKEVEDHIASKAHQTTHQDSAEVKKAVMNAKKVADAAVHSASRTKTAVAQDVKGAAKKADGVVKKIEDTAKHAAHDVKAIVGQVVDQAKKDFDADKSKVSKAKDTVKHDLKAQTAKVEDAVQQATKEANAIVGQAVRQGKANVDAAAASAHKAKDSILHSARDAFTKGEVALDSAEKRIEAIVNGAEKRAGSALGRAETAVGAAVQDIIKTAEGAEELIFQAAHVAQDAVVGAAGVIPKSVHDAEAAVENVAHTAKDTVDTALTAAQKTSDAASKSIHKSAHDAREVAEEAATKAKETIGSAVGAAQKTRDAVVHGAQEKVKQAETAAKTVALEAKKTVDQAIGSAYHAKDAAVQRANQVAQEARATVDSAVGAAKNAIVQNVVTPVRQAEHMIENAVEIGKGTVEAAIQGAREASEKLEKESKKITVKSPGAAKAALDNAIATAHRTEDHVAKNLKSTANRVETVAQKAGHDAIAALDSALAMAQKTEDHVVKSLKNATHQKSSSSWPQKKKGSSTTLDHGDYVYRNKEGARVSEQEADEGSDDDYENDDDNHKGSGSGSILASAPSIFHNAKVAAAAMVAKAADVGYENLDVARHKIEDMVDNLTENLAGHEEPAEDEQDDDQADTPRASNSGWTKSKGDLQNLDDYRALHKGFPSKSTKTDVKKAGPATTSASKIAVPSTKSTHSSSLPSSHANRGVFDSAQHAIAGATDNLADVADNVSQMLTDAKDSVSKAVKKAKEIAAETKKGISHGNSAAQQHSARHTTPSNPGPVHVSSLASAPSSSKKGHLETAHAPAQHIPSSHATPKTEATKKDQKNKHESASTRWSKPSISSASSAVTYAAVAAASKERSETNADKKKATSSNASPSSSVAKESDRAGHQNKKPESHIFKDVNLAAATSHIEPEISEEEHAYKPNLHSHHVDKDGFTIVEDPHLVHETEEKKSASAGPFYAPTHYSSQNKTQHHQHLLPKDPNHRHVDTPAVSRPESAASSYHSGIDTSAVYHSSTEPGLTYSGAVQLNVDENDHGPVLGRSEILIAGPPQPLPHGPDYVPPRTHNSAHSQSLFQNEDFVVAVPEGHHDHHNQRAHRQRAHSHEGQGTTLGGAFLDLSNQNKKNKTKDSKQEFTVDQYGNKVPVVAARRDSGFNMLM